MANSVSVKVEQKDGEITVRKDGHPPKTWKVEDHLVHVASADLQHFLRAVEGSREVDKSAKPAAEAKDGK